MLGPRRRFGTPSPRTLEKACRSTLSSSTIPTVQQGSPMRVLHSLGVATVLLALAGTAADAQTFPNRPIRLVVPYAPGGALDYSGRLLAKTLSDSVGQQVVVDNRPGAGGVIGTEGVVRSPPDGYTLLLMDSAIVVTPSLQKSVPYDVIKDLQ